MSGELGVGLWAVAGDGHRVPALSGKAGTELLKPARNRGLRLRPMPPRVNKVWNGDETTLIKEIALDAG